MTENQYAQSGSETSSPDYPFDHTSDQPSWQPWSHQEAMQNRVLYFLPSRHSVSITEQRLYIEKNRKKEFVPLSELNRVVFLGVPCCEAALIYRLIKKNITVEFLDSFARTQGVACPVEENRHCLSAVQDSFQHKPGERFALASVIIHAKISNSARFLKRHGLDVDALRLAADELLLSEDCATWDALRGLEGNAARQYFGKYAELLAPFVFEGRKTRPAPDPVNSMLSLGYVLLHNRLAHALEQAGCNARQGFFHASRGRHWALASDLMEDMRFLVDKLVFRLIRKGNLTPDDFMLRGLQCVFRTGEAFSKYVHAFEDMMALTRKAPVARPGYEPGSVVSANQWLDATARAYVAFISRGEPYIPLSAW
jgi:CRISPR-associated protein Cas1